MDEEKAKKILNEITNEVTGGKPLLRYTTVDLIQFAKFRNDNPDLKIHECIKKYVPLMERRKPTEMLKNLLNGLGIENEI